MLDRRVSHSPELRLLGSIADEMVPEGRVWLARKLLGSLGVEVQGSLSKRSEDALQAADA